MAQSDAFFSPLLALPNSYRAFYSAFPHLNPIQKQTIFPILQGKDLILQSATGSGKTEAVLAPVIERLIQKKNKKADSKNDNTKNTNRFASKNHDPNQYSSNKYNIIYLVPTKALAIDLKRRIHISITEKLGLAIGLRTGDLKQAGGDNPDLIITTPESFDVMMGSKNINLRHFIRHIGTIIIDEAHSLVFNYRGEQLKALLQRLTLKSNHRLQKIALSATMGDLEQISSFFDFEKKTVKIKSSSQRDIIPHLVVLNKTAEISAFLEDLRKHWEYKKILIFVNNRGRCDQLLALFERSNLFKDQVKLHYSNIKTSERHAVETWFRTQKQAICIATSTLELGIDIGNVDSVVLFEPPDSVAGFLQRIGRSNRKQNHIHFWGICYGSSASHQLLRFLAFLSLSSKNKMEQQNAKKLNSVYFQQILSCCYEKSQLSLDALSVLFPEKKRLLSDIFSHMGKNYWLKESKNKSLFSGGKRYYDYLLEYKIWNNFPETDEEYVLELEEQAIADLPVSLVKQLDIGDKVLLAGKHVQITQIEEFPYKRVIAIPNRHQQDNKEIFWIGRGCHLSYDVAQEIKILLQHSNPSLEGLFRRTQQLFQQLHKNYHQSVLLENKMVVSRSTNGFFRYWTFLGAIGNLILQRTIEEQLDKDEIAFNTISDDTGIECSQCVDFQKLSLPKTEHEFKNWCYRYQSVLLSIFSLNSFARFLPQRWLLEELNSFLYEPRLLEHFIDYQQLSSTITHGDPDFFVAPQSDRHEPEIIKLPASLPKLLTLEKERYKEPPWVPYSAEKLNKPFISITGTLLANYIRHQQCHRWLFFKCSESSKCPPEIKNNEPGHETLLEQGIKFEQECIHFLRQKEHTIITIESFIQGQQQSLEQRFKETIKQLFAISTAIYQNSDSKNYILTQAVLIAPFFATNASKITEAVGIPDFIRLSKVSSGKKVTVLWEVGDIKNSRQPQYYQKWQLAFYLLLLIRLKNKSFHSQKTPFSIKIATHGTLITKPLANSIEPSIHFFNLEPYLKSFPTLIRNMDKIVSFPESISNFQLNAHCTSCGWFGYCYRQALTQDIYLLSGLSPGILQKFVLSNIKTLLQADTLLNDDPNNKPKIETEHHQEIFDHAQSERIRLQLQALQNNWIISKSSSTHLYPENISEIIFLHCTLNPNSLNYSHHEIAFFSWQVMDLDGKLKESDFWPQEGLTLTDSLKHLWTVWCRLIVHQKGPHIFHFGAQPWDILYHWTLGLDIHFLWEQEEQCYHTDIQAVLASHFYFPIPGILSLASINYLINSTDSPSSPSELPISFFHPNAQTLLQQSSDQAQATLSVFEDYAKIYRQLLTRLKSSYQQTHWKNKAKDNSSHSRFSHFIELEKEIKEADIIALQKCTLDERIAKYRAIAPIFFKSSQLDDEGHFIYCFKMPPLLAKFRSGDFLKLALVGMSDVQEGAPVILLTIDPDKGELFLKSRQGKLTLSLQSTNQFSYSLEEDISDFTSDKLLHICEEIFNSKHLYPITRLLQGETQSIIKNNEISQWISDNQQWMHLNSRQQQALIMPFTTNLSLIEGPPGTGKTHLLGWIIIALFFQAQKQGRPLRILVSALTHQAIDHVLNKVIALANTFFPDNFALVCAKWGRFLEPEPESADGQQGHQVHAMQDKEEVTTPPYLLLGATGFGCYQLFNGKQGIFPPFFDYVVFDEASQVLIPQALLSLIYGKGNFIFLGDVQQLPPIIKGNYNHSMVKQSILENLLSQYSETNRVRLNTSYRMNQEICEFPSAFFYQKQLISAVASHRLLLNRSRFIEGSLQVEDSTPVEDSTIKDPENDLIGRLIDPEKPVSLLLLDHRGYHQKCSQEVDTIVDIVQRLIVYYSIACEDIGIIAPHRAQNNAIRAALQDCLEIPLEQLPLIDTVERIQGAEREIILFSMTTSDLDHIENEFLNNPNRFNVALTRAKTKLIVIASQAFFNAIAHDETALKNNECFKCFLDFCYKQDYIYVSEK